MKSENKNISFEDPIWDFVFNPKSVVIIGKTERAKGAYLYITSLKNFEFSGDVYVVSTDGGDGQGFETFEKITDLPDGIDYAILAVPADKVPDTLRKLETKGIKVAHVFSSGFADLETQAGKKLEEELKKASRETGIRIIGPNCLGVFSPRSGMAFPPGIFPKELGNIGFVSQSGGTSQSFAWCGGNYNYRLSKGVSIGNSADIDILDLFEYMKDDPETEIIGLYIEGVKNGDRFMELLGATSSKKPVLILKAGMSEAGVIATSSHTGIMAGKAHIWEAAIRQAGGILVETFDELVETASAFTKKRGRPKRNIALVNRGGGEGILAADILPKIGLCVPLYSETTQKALSDIIPKAGTGFKNPLDFAAVGGFPGVFDKVFEIIDDDENTDTIIYQHHIEFAHLFSRKEYNEYLLDALISFYKKSKKTLLVVMPFYYSGDVWLKSFRHLTSNGVSAHTTITGAAHAALHLSEYEEIKKRG